MEFGKVLLTYNWPNNYAFMNHMLSSIYNNLAILCLKYQLSFTNLNISRTDNIKMTENFLSSALSILDESNGV